MEVLKEGSWEEKAEGELSPGRQLEAKGEIFIRDMSLI